LLWAVASAAALFLSNTGVGFPNSKKSVSLPLIPEDLFRLEFVRLRCGCANRQESFVICFADHPVVAV
jgi:hypothetical protein